MRYGAAYYPEHWPQERWPIDARMMQDAGFNLVRMAEFAWTRMEPREGEFDFAWLDDAMGVLADHGIETMLCTPTATPPAWVCEQSPEILPVDKDGRIINFGARRHYCPTRASYREYTERIVRAMGTHYAGHPHVPAWQIDNEFAGSAGWGYCYCDSCQIAFQRWCKEQYGTLDALNQAWGTDVWSMRFTDWDEIPVPGPTTAPGNPSLLLAWRRFYTDVWTDYYRFQVSILRECGVTVPMTTNLMGLFPEIDYYTHAQALDFVAWDNYPSNYPTPAGHFEPAMGHDLMRSIKGGQPFWVTEQQSGAGGQGTIFARTGPGYIRLMAYQGIAHGAEAMLFFRWRTARFGAEQYWHGILQHDGRENWRYAEVKRLGQELRALPEALFTARTPAQVAVLFSHDQQWAHDIQQHVKGFAYQQQALALYEALRDNGVDVDLVNEESDLTPYRVLLAPSWQLIPADTAEQVIEFVRRGGTAVFTYRSGVKDWDSVIFSDPLPGPLRDLLGITVDDYDALGAQDATVGVRTTGAAPVTGTFTGTTWAEVLIAEEASPAALYTDGWYAGTPAVTVNRFGEGEAWYVATHLGAEFWKPFIEYVLASQAFQAAPASSEGVEIARRQGDRLYTFVLNLKQCPGWIELDDPATDLLTGEELGAGMAALEPFGVRILVSE